MLTINPTPNKPQNKPVQFGQITHFRPKRKKLGQLEDNARSILRKEALKKYSGYKPAELKALINKKIMKPIQYLLMPIKEGPESKLSYIGITGKEDIKKVKEFAKKNDIFIRNLEENPQSNYKIYTEFLKTQKIKPESIEKKYI